MLAMKSVIGDQVRPPLVVRQMPPEAPPNQIICGLAGWTTRARTRPPMLPGAIHFHPEGLMEDGDIRGTTAGAGSSSCGSGLGNGPTGMPATVAGVPRAALAARVLGVAFRCTATCWRISLTCWMAF